MANDNIQNNKILTIGLVERNEIENFPILS